MKARSIPLLLALPLTFGAGQSHAGTWYFCDPLRAYYPSVRTCPAPWHPVEAPNPGPVPPQLRTPAPRPDRASQIDAGYKEGMKAREDWWSWRVSLDGSYRDGVNYWTSHRKLTQPGTCDEPVGITDPDPTFSQGCEDAQERLKPIDAKLKGEPGFRRGWAAFKPSPEAIEAARKARAQSAPDAGVDPAQERPTQDQPPQSGPPQDQQGPDAAPPAGSPPPPQGLPPAQQGY